MRKGLVSLLVACAALSFATAVAQTAGGDPSIGTGGYGGAVLGAFLPTLLTGVGAGLLALLAFGSKYLDTKTALIKNERLQKAMHLLADLAFEKVRQLSQESIALLKAAASDGRLTTAEASAAASTAAREVWKSLPNDLRVLFVKLAGSETAAVETYIKPKIEAAVTSQGRVTSLTVNPPSLGLKPVNGTALNNARARIGL